MGAHEGPDSGDAPKTDATAARNDDQAEAKSQDRPEPPGPGDGSADVSAPTDPEAELEQLRAENVRLRAIATDVRRRVWARRRRRGRRWGAGILAGLSCLLIVLSATIVWSHQTILETEGFVSTVAPVMKEPAVTAAISKALTQQISSTLQLQDKVAGELPPVARPLVAPIASQVRSFIQTQITGVLRSPTFYSVWTGALRFTHGQVLSALRGDTKALRITNDEVVLNLVPLVNEALRQIQSAASGLLGRNIELPTITNATPPAQARAELSKALGVPIPSDFGHIVLLRSDAIKIAQGSVSLADLLVWLLPLLSALVLVAAVGVSLDRRRTLLQVAVATIVLVVLIRRLTMYLQSHLIHEATNQAAVSSILRHLLGGLFGVTAWMLVAFGLAAVLLVVVGPYAWARWLRTRAATTALPIGEGAVEVAGGVLRTGTRGEARTRWIMTHRALLQGAGAVVGAILLLVVPFFWFLVVLALLVAYELALASVSLPGRRAVPTNQRP